MLVYLPVWAIHNCRRRSVCPQSLQWLTHYLLSNTNSVVPPIIDISSFIYSTISQVKFCSIFPSSSINWRSADCQPFICWHIPIPVNHFIMSNSVEYWSQISVHSFPLDLAIMSTNHYTVDPSLSCHSSPSFFPLSAFCATCKLHQLLTFL